VYDYRKRESRNQDALPNFKTERVALFLRILEVPV
jgi:hypothetical protein